MTTRYYTACSLDGFIADAQNALDWLVHFEPIPESSYPAFIREVGAIAMGSTTYQWLLDHHIHPESERPGPWPYTQPTWVFSTRTLPSVPGADLRFVRGDVRPVHWEMVRASGGKDIWIVGGGDLAGQFYDHNLLDELIVQMAPVTLGSGRPLFPRALVTPPLQLVSTQTFSPGFVELRYRVPRHEERRIMAGLDPKAQPPGTD